MTEQEKEMDKTVDRVLLALHRQELQQEQAKSKAYDQAKKNGPPDTTNAWYKDGQHGDWKRKPEEPLSERTIETMRFREGEARAKDRRERGEKER